MWSMLLNRHQAVSTLLLFFIFGSPAILPAEQAPGEAEKAKISYFRQIRPIFQAKCQGCHQPAKPLGDYVMTSFQQLLAGGETGDAAVVAGQPDESYLIQQITPVDGEAEMPKQRKPLNEGQIALVRTWIEQGAVDDTPAAALRTYDAEHPPTYVRPPVITSLD